jgi:hypothetical protein
VTGLRDGRHTRSSKEPANTVTYFCTGGAGAQAAAEVARTGLTRLPSGGHAPVAGLNKPSGQRPGDLRCPVCGLTKRIGYRARQRIRAAGLTQVDISALPF